MKEQDVCQVNCVHQDKVDKVKVRLSKENVLDVTKIFKALSDETRLNIALALTEEEELCVCDVANIVDASTATASHHLRLLKKHGIAKYRKEGKLVYYSLDDVHVRQLISVAFEHQREVKDNG
ncbi:ArsR/SmtB family transcription factor [Mesobacillus foraminis]|uniref:DNA-binding transcriptional ArsR family regulator n=1 Tax=Mesobacillus foraminis TaxID=279826 RepID=A0A4R2BD77_9BACI|nr:metalloregulator ArsR/SmtB family transcription factor [Mesobacillus foraminis]TCN24881.1 DNA-binding transcriptional ArsR family regulator [Mesobacillus foraminis]